MGKPVTIQIKRIYEKPSESDGYRVLVDRLWPRGVSKEAAQLDEWRKELAPSTELRKWFDHDPSKFETFTRRYVSELKENQDLIEEVLSNSHSTKITLLYGAKDREHNQAVVLKEVLERMGDQEPQ